MTYKTSAKVTLTLKELQQTMFRFMSHDTNIYKHSLIVLGIANRTYELTESTLWAIENNRPHSAALTLRGLIETLAFTYYFIDEVYKNGTNTEKIERVLFGSRNGITEFESVNILTCIDKAVKMFPNLKQSYGDLSEIAHPNVASLFLAGTPEDTNGKVTFALPTYKFKEQDKEKMLNQTGECCFHISRLFSELTTALEKAKGTKPSVE